VKDGAAACQKWACEPEKWACDDAYETAQLCSADGREVAQTTDCARKTGRFAAMAPAWTRCVSRARRVVTAMQSQRALPREELRTRRHVPMASAVTLR